MAERYGVGEWFGKVVSGQAGPQLKRLARKAALGFKQADMPCPFRETVEPGARCNKKGGVCSLQLYREALGGVKPVGSFVTMCPSRFWQDASVFRWIGEEVLGTSTPTLIKEVDFLESVLGASEDEDQEEKEREAVGRIDTVLMHPTKAGEWCALELQAVYFSGAGMPSHLAQYADADRLVFPDKQRRPDFRSSGPKRLMPQLQTKVPTLRRWGKKMTVVVDLPFFKSLGPMVTIPHLSNCDIAWFVVDYDPATGKMSLSAKVYTTLESSVEALTAGIPRSKEAFENRMAGLLTASTKAAKKKIIRLS
jgi:hypothetical protein